MAHQERTFMDDVREVNPLFFAFVGILVGLALAALVSNTSALVDEFASGINPKDLAPSVVDIALTVLVLDRLAERRERNREERELKDLLIREMSSQDNGVALHAVVELGARGWLYNGSLDGVRLIGANLQKATLFNAYLKNVQLPTAQLQQANLERADLEGTDLRGASLQNASLCNADLRRAHLEFSDLGEADLRGAKLQGTDLTDSNMQGVRLEKGTRKSYSLMGYSVEHLSNIPLELPLGHAEFSEETTLPNGARWTPNVDLARFTNPDHPDFWRPEPGSVWWYPADKD